MPNAAGVHEPEALLLTNPLLETGLRKYSTLILD